jgi:hypothetical protein
MTGNSLKSPGQSPDVEGVELAARNGAELRRVAGTQLDPRVVDALLAVLG